ncbi:hypothetical protein AGDE_16281 [Angomonas deanei]|uniref:Uncharacterized protein n=1 Tax=Angomonas deanei TaxID=59799 RepID=A0A7G2C1K1_9TRYP|nr:hypothetical protein AGDE_16281 [Angomonas deanei]CAD2213539.1 hypothetical protein, conserved [Angomonas deanei]|eukprot:EPY17385.1 hypothetical protein AGDE_16281 [Angomonas deanei]
MDSVVSAGSQQSSTSNKSGKSVKFVLRFGSLEDVEECKQFLLSTVRDAKVEKKEVFDFHGLSPLPTPAASPMIPPGESTTVSVDTTQK